MKNLIQAVLTVAALTSSASAGGMVITLPSLTFPPAGDASAAKTCLPDSAAADRCVLAE